MSSVGLDETITPAEAEQRTEVCTAPLVVCARCGQPLSDDGCPDVCACMDPCVSERIEG